MGEVERLMAERVPVERPIFTEPPMVAEARRVPNETLIGDMEPRNRDGHVPTQGSPE